MFNNETGLYDNVPWLEHGLWCEDANGTLYIIPNDRHGHAEIHGPGDDTEDALNALCRTATNAEGFPDPAQVEALGLTIIPDALKRFGPEDGYYHA
jgi:hypothetical protein